MSDMRAATIVLLLLTAFSSSVQAKPKQGEPCDAEGKCAHGLTCVKYYGVAGPRGPEMTSCEIRCKGTKGHCPKAQSCVTIADGPGAVCRPNASHHEPQPQPQPSPPQQQQPATAQ
jgi:hypothetical protein